VKAQVLPLGFLWFSAYSSLSLHVRSSSPRQTQRHDIMLLSQVAMQYTEASAHVHSNGENSAVFSADSLSGAEMAHQKD
jgi:hypothetical protein